MSRRTFEDGGDACYDQGTAEARYKAQGFIAVEAVAVMEAIGRWVSLHGSPPRAPFKMVACPDLAAEVLVLTSASSPSDCACRLLADAAFEASPWVSFLSAPLGHNLQ